MDLHLRPERHEPHECVVGEQLHRLPERGFREFELLGDHAGVEDEDEDRRRRRASSPGGVEGAGGGGGGGGVLDGGVLRVELAGEVGLGYGGVVRGETVTLVAEGADPDLGGEVDAREGVECGGAGLAA